MLRTFLGILFVFSAVLASAQPADGEGWAGVGVSHKLNKKIVASGALQVRVNGWGTQVKTSFAEASLSYKYNKYIRLKANYRWGPRWNGAGFSANRHRTNIDVALKYRKKPFTYSLRTRGQLEYDNLYQTEIAVARTYTLRIKPKVSYRVNKKTDFAVAVELFKPLNSRLGNRIDNLRFGASLAKDLKKGRSVSYGYALEQGINVPGPGTTHIFAVEYNFRLK